MDILNAIPLPEEPFYLFFERNVVPNSKRRAVFTADELIDLFEGKDIIDSC
jgi:hypothetical protein